MHQWRGHTLSVYVVMIYFFCMASGPPWTTGVQKKCFLSTILCSVNTRFSDKLQGQHFVDIQIIQVWFFRTFLKLGVQEDSDVTGNVPEIIRIRRQNLQLFSHPRHPFNSFWWIDVAKDLESQVMTNLRYYLTRKNYHIGITSAAWWVYQFFPVFKTSRKIHQCTPSSSFK